MRVLRGLCRALALLLPLAAEAAPSTVLVSHHALGLIASAVAGPDTEVRVLVPAGQSAHGFALRPSDRQWLVQADLVVWTGPAMEPFLVRPLAQRDRPSLLLEQALHLHLRGHGEHDDAHDHDHAPSRVENDPHLWLDPRLAARVAEAIADRLAADQPAQADAFLERAARFRGEAEVLEQNMAVALAPVRARGLAVMHDSLGRLVERFGLHQHSALSTHPEMPLGARRLADLRSAIASGEVVCLVREPQFPAPLPPALLDDARLHTVWLDVMGSNIPLQPDGYFRLMRGLAQELAACLAP